MSFLHPVRGFSIFVILALAIFMAAPMAEGASPAPVGRGTASDFAVLGGSTVTNTGLTVLSGNLGLSPGTSITGFPPGKVNGTIHQTDAVAVQAKKDLVTAYDDAAGRSATASVSADLGGQTLKPGVYTGNPGLHLTGTLTLDGQNDQNAVFIFQAPASTLITASSSRVELTRGADACNVVWQVGSSATLGTDSVFTGNILALQSITLNDGVTVNGSALARNAAVTLHRNTISRAACAAGTTGTTGGSSPTSTGGGSSTATGGGSSATGTTATGGGSSTATGAGLSPAGTGGGSSTATGGGSSPSGTTPSGGGSSTDTAVRSSTELGGGSSTTDSNPHGPLAATGPMHARGVAQSGLALAGLGLAILSVTRRRTVN
jgi:hypothetical protein